MGNVESPQRGLSPAQSRRVSADPVECPYGIERERGFPLHQPNRFGVWRMIEAQHALAVRREERPGVFDVMGLQAPSGSTSFHFDGLKRDWLVERPFDQHVDCPFPTTHERCPPTTAGYRLDRRSAVRVDSASGAETPANRGARRRQTLARQSTICRSKHQSLPLLARTSSTSGAGKVRSKHSFIGMRFPVCVIVNAAARSRAQLAAGAPASLTRAAA